MENEVLKYDGRKNILFEMLDKSERNSIKTMVKCECKTIVKLNKKNSVCPNCGNIINKENSVLLQFKDYKIFNTSTTMFVDEDKVTISMGMITAYRDNFCYHPMIGEHFMRLKVRFDLNKKTAILYMNGLRVKDNIWEYYKLPNKYINFTQPVIDYLDNPKYDIVLPKELVSKFCCLIGVETPTKEVSLKDLAWMNRLRLPLKECMSQRYILQTFNQEKFDNLNAYKASCSQLEYLHSTLSKIYRSDYIEIDAPFSDFRNEDIETKTNRLQENIRKEELDLKEYKLKHSYFNKVENRVKRYLKTNYKPKNYDENTYKALLEALKINQDHIPKEFEKHYYQNPEAIYFAETHNTLFKNRDVRVNAINAASSNDNKIYNGNIDNVTVANDIFYNGENNPGENVSNTIKVLDIIRAKAITLFKTEVNILNKVKSNGRYDLLNDTIDMISKIRKSKKDIETKGNIVKLHQNATTLYTYIELPDVEFDLTKDKEDISYAIKNDEYTFIFAKTPKELMDIHYTMDICVGSYYKRCMANNTSIVTLNTNNKYIACLEFSHSFDGGEKVLIQAKGNSNSALSIKIQNIIANFCLDQNIRISTYDIKKEIQETNNTNLLNVSINRKVS